MLSSEYLAGLFDGEGCVRLNRNRRTYGDLKRLKRGGDSNE